MSRDDLASQRDWEGYAEAGATRSRRGQYACAVVWQGTSVQPLSRCGASKQGRVYKTEEEGEEEE